MKNRKKWEKMVKNNLIIKREKMGKKEKKW